MHVEVRVGQVGQRIRMAASVASRYALGADGVGAARPGACMCSPPITHRVAS